MQRVNTVNNSKNIPTCYSIFENYIAKNRIPKIALQNNDDLDSFTREGIYIASYDSIGNSLVHRPENQIYASVMFVFISPNNMGWQILISGNRNIYYRVSNDVSASPVVWFDWKKIST